jgi:D-apionolactonase
MPQAHAFDDLSIVETLAGQTATVSSARAFVGHLPLAITPITLRRRPRQGEPVAWPPTDPRSPDDPRQASAFVGAWTLGSLATLAGTGVA